MGNISHPHLAYIHAWAVISRCDLYDCIFYLKCTELYESELELTLKAAWYQTNTFASLKSKRFQILINYSSVMKPNIIFMWAEAFFIPGIFVACMANSSERESCTKSQQHPIFESGALLIATCDSARSFWHNFGRVFRQKVCIPLNNARPELLNVGKTNNKIVVF